MEDIEENEPKVNKLKCSFSQTSGKVTIKVCRVCSKEMLLQNYSTHLKMKHPKENFKDLRGKSDQNIKGLFLKKQLKQVKDVDNKSETSAYAETEDPRLNRDSIEDENCGTKELEHVKQADTALKNLIKQQVLVKRQ